MLNYNAPIKGAGYESAIDGVNEKGQQSTQMNSFFWLKKAIIEARKEQFFTPLASVTHMP